MMSRILQVLHGTLNNGGTGVGGTGVSPVRNVREFVQPRRLHHQLFRSLLLLITAASLNGAALAANVGDDEAFAFERERPAAGFWIGHVQADGQETFMALTIEYPPGVDQPLANVTILNVGLIEASAAQVIAAQNQISFTAKSPFGDCRFSGRVAEDGQSIAGDFALQSPPAPAVAGTIALRRSVKVMQLPEPQAFTGALDVPGMGKLAMTLALAQTPAGNWVGHIDVPAQDIRGYPLTPVLRTGDGITATVPLPEPATIRVQLGEDQQRIKGSFIQGGSTLPVDFARDERYVGPLLKRPQHPVPPFPYSVREIRVKRPAAEGGHLLAGALTIPQGQGPHPLAILISGSGQQDRDETILGHKPFLVLADYFTRRGIAVMRYDDRGVGESTGGHTLAGCTMKDFAADTVAVLEHVKSMPEIDGHRIGLIGHSEGGVIAPMIASQRDDIAFIVLLAASAVPGRDVLVKQGELLFAAQGADPEKLAVAVQRHERALDLLIQGASYQDISQAVTELIEAQGQASGSPVPKHQVGPLIHAQVSMLTLPWMEHFLTYDPRPALANVECPVLALNGSLDLQVSHEQNLPEVEKAVRSGGGDVTVKTYERLNHLFQPATTGSVTEYGAIEITIDPTVLRDIESWIKSKTAPIKNSAPK